MLRNVRGAIESFAEYIMENLLLPLRASSATTPQPTPASLSALQTATIASSSHRISILRQSCLVQDHHTCVISRKFDTGEAISRGKKDGQYCKDDDGNLPQNQSRDRFQYLEVAHILPHSLTTVSSGSTDLSDSLFPVVRTLTLSPNHTIDPPSHRLLAVHRAIARIIKLSAAGGYIGDILRDLEDVFVKADGSTNLGHLVTLRIGGWLETTVH